VKPFQLSQTTYLSKNETAASQLQWQGDEWAFLRMSSLIFMRIRGQLGYLSQTASQPSSQPSEHTQPVAMSHD